MTMEDDWEALQEGTKDPEDFSYQELFWIIAKGKDLTIKDGDLPPNNPMWTTAEDYGIHLISHLMENTFDAPYHDLYDGTIGSLWDAVHSMWKEATKQYGPSGQQEPFIIDVDNKDLSGEAPTINVLTVEIVDEISDSDIHTIQIHGPDGTRRSATGKRKIWDFEPDNDKGQTDFGSKGWDVVATFGGVVADMVPSPWQGDKTVTFTRSIKDEDTAQIKVKEDGSTNPNDDEEYDYDSSDDDEYDEDKAPHVNVEWTPKDDDEIPNKLLLAFWDWDNELAQNRVVEWRINERDWHEEHTMAGTGPGGSIYNTGVLHPRTWDRDDTDRDIYKFSIKTWLKDKEGKKDIDEELINPFLDIEDMPDESTLLDADLDKIDKERYERALHDWDFTDQMYAPLVNSQSGFDRDIDLLWHRCTWEMGEDDIVTDESSSHKNEAVNNLVFRQKRYTTKDEYLYIENQYSQSIIIVEKMNRNVITSGGQGLTPTEEIKKWDTLGYFYIVPGATKAFKTKSGILNQQDEYYQFWVISCYATLSDLPTSLRRKIKQANKNVWNYFSDNKYKLRNSRKTGTLWSVDAEISEGMYDWAGDMQILEPGMEQYGDEIPPHLYPEGYQPSAWGGLIGIGIIILLIVGVYLIARYDLGKKFKEAFK